MRTPTKHLNARTGETYWRVRYRRTGGQHALTFYGEHAERDADEFAKLLDSLGADRAVAFWNANLEPDRSDVLSVDAWWDRYLKSVTGITEGTRITYQRIYDRVWQPTIGRMPVDMVSTEDIAAVVNDLSDKQRKADKTVANAYMVIASAFKVAVARHVIPATPCVGIKMPRRTEHTDTEMRFLTYPEWQTLAEHLPGAYLPLFTMLAGTGMRWGEAEALNVGDVVLDVPVPVVRISKAAKWNGSKSSRDIGPTKTKQSNRSVSLPAEVIDAVQPLLERPARHRLFLAAKGGELRHSKVYEVWIAANIAAGLGEWVARPGQRRLWTGPRIHDLRHSHVAWLIAAGIPLPVIRARLGHSSIQVTVDRYGHLLPDLQVAAAHAASVAMGGAAAISAASTD